MKCLSSLANLPRGKKSKYETKILGQQNHGQNLGTEDTGAAGSALNCPPLGFLAFKIIHS